MESQALKKAMESEAIISYKKAAGDKMEEIIEISGAGSMLFHAVCEILKSLARAEEKSHGCAGWAESYVNAVCMSARFDLLKERGEAQ